MGSVSLDWSSAQVRDGRLEVQLRGEQRRDWKASFDRTVGLLAGGDWGKVRLKRDRVRVHGVTAGGEERLHHYLESVVMQANSAQDHSEDEAHEDLGVERNDREHSDAEMTSRFRSFAAESHD